MSLVELVLAHTTIAVLVITAMVVVLIRDPASRQSVFARANWDFLLALPLRNKLSGEMWLMLFIVAFITFCAGVIVVVFVLPFGFAWAIAAMIAAVAVLIGLVPKALK